MTQGYSKRFTGENCIKGEAQCKIRGQLYCVPGEGMLGDGGYGAQEALWLFKG